MKFKTTAIMAAALLAAFGANAGTLAGGTQNFAAEAFKGTTATDANTAITVAPVVYTVSTTSGIVVNSGGKLSYYLRLASGTFTAAPGIGEFATSIAGFTVGAPVLSVDKTTVMVPLTAIADVNIGLGSTVTFAPSATTIAGVKTALGAVGGTVSATGVLALGAATAPDATVALPASIDGAAPTAVIAKSVQAITGVVSNLPTNTDKIDLSATPSASAYTPVATSAKLGSVTFTNAAAAVTPAGSTFDIAAANASLTVPVVVTPAASQSFPVGAVLSADLSTSCTTSVASVTAFTTTTASAAATISVPIGSVTSGNPVYVCLSAPSGTNVATPISPTITATLANSAVATAGQTQVTGAGYALGYNGTQIDVSNYLPIVLATSGFEQYLRIANTGSREAAVSVALIDQDTGVVGASAPVVTLKPGASKTIRGSDIEAALGVTLAAEARPRLRVTAPTTGLTVQNMLMTSGGFTNNSSAQGQPQ